MTNCPPETDICNAPHDNGYRGVIKLVCIGVFFLLLPVMVRLLGGQAYFLKMSRMIGSIQEREYGTLLAILAYLMVGGGLISIGVPRLWISAGAGAVFNPWLGTGVALGASLIGAATLFLVGGIFFTPGRWTFPENRLGRYRYAFQQRAFLWVLYARLFPFSNSTILSLFSGYCKIGYIPYIAASLIGAAPLTIIMCLFGSGAIHGTGRTFYIFMGFILIGLLHILTLILKKWLPMAAISTPHKEK